MEPECGGPRTSSQGRHTPSQSTFPFSFSDQSFFHVSYTSDYLRLTILANRAIASPRSLDTPEIISFTRVNQSFLYLHPSTCHGKCIINLYEISEKKYHQIIQASGIRFPRKVRHISEVGIFTHKNDTIR